MTLPAVSRIFFAIDLPEPIKAQVHDYMLALKKKAKTNAIIWTKPIKLHITLQFLPKVKNEDIQQLVKNVRQEMVFTPTIKNLELGKIQLFPSPFRPRVIVLEVSPLQLLTELAQAVGQGIINTQYEVDSRPYRPHLTLARIKHTQRVDLEFLNAVPSLAVGVLPVEEIVLFRSEPQPDGSHYAALEKIALLKA